MVNSKPETVRQMPWLLPDYQVFHDQIYDWGLDMLPPTKMSYDLPARYTESSDFEWSVGFVSAPDCPKESPYMYLVKSGRGNDRARHLIRKYYHMTAKYLMKLPDGAPRPTCMSDSDCFCFFFILC